MSVLLLFVMAIGLVGVFCVVGSGPGRARRSAQRARTGREEEV